MQVLIPNIVSLATAFLFWLLLRFAVGTTFSAEQRPIRLILPVAVVALYTLCVTVLGFSLHMLTLSVTVFLFTLAACFWLMFRGKGTSRRVVLIRRLTLVTMVVIALELSVFNYSAYSSPRKGQTELNLNDAQTDVLISPDGTVSLNSEDKSVITWQFNGQDVQNIALRFSNVTPYPISVSVSARDKNTSVYATELYTKKAVVSNKDAIYIPVSSRGMKELILSFDSAQAVLSGVTVNEPKPVSANMLRLFLLILFFGAVVLIRTCGLHKIIYQPGRLLQRVVTVIAALLCILVLLSISAAHINDSYANSSLLYTYNGVAEGRDPYYQLFDAFQKGQLNLDISVDPRLITAGEQAYDWSYRSAEGISCAWDRAFYDGKYYSYFGTAPLFLFYYPVYFVTGRVPTTTLACGFFGSLFIIFGFMVVFKAARTVVGQANYLLTLCCASVLPLMTGIYTLAAYGDFYNLPKLSALSFLLLLYYFTIEGYERPRWSVFLLCGICVGVMAASRPNAVIAALGLAPLYIGVLMKRELNVRRKAVCVAAFILPMAVAAAALMAYNAARFGSPAEFGAKYQLTVNNIAMNNVSLGFLGMAVYQYFLQLPEVSPTFPYFSPQFVKLSTYTRYFYVMEVTGVLALPLNWSLVSYPALRRRSGIKTAYRLSLALSVLMAVVLALLDFSLGGVAISYVCDIAATIAAVAIILLLSAEKSARGCCTVHKGIYIVAGCLITATFIYSVLLLLGTSPYFIRNSMPEVYSALQGVCCF